jgi:hypothetical protein
MASFSKRAIDFLFCPDPQRHLRKVFDANRTSQEIYHKWPNGKPDAQKKESEPKFFAPIH